MKRGKDDDKMMGPMFPRLHVNDTGKGGPRAPPRNKMALYEQLTIPSQPRYNSGAHNNSNNTMAPSTSTMQGTGHEQNMYFPLYRPPLASSYDEVQVNRPEVVDARNQPAQRENRRQPLEEDDFMVPIFSQPGIKLYNGKTQNNMHEGRRNHTGSGHSTALPCPGEKETDQRNRGDLNSKQQMKNLDGRSSRVYDAPARHSSDVLMREKDDWRKDACAQSGYPDRYRVINLEKTNSNLRQDHEDGVSATGATHLVGVSDQPLEYPGKEISLKLNHAPPVGSNYRGDNETGNGMQRVEEYRTLEKESLDRGDDVSETSMEDTSDLDITPDDVVRIIGRKHFWKARTAISTALHFFHLRTSIEAALSFGLLHVPIIQEINFGWQIVVGSIIGFCGAAFGSVSGVGGGGIFVPMLSLVIGFDPKSATAISKCPREVTGAVDLITHYKLLSHHEFFCKKILFVSIADTHYL